MARAPKYDDTELLDRAVDLVWRRGWAATTISDLERALDVKAPSIYRRFGSRDGVGVAVIDHYIDRVVSGRVASYLCGEGDPIENIRRFLDSSVTRSESTRALRGCLLTTTSSDDLDEAMRQAVVRGMTMIESGLRAEVARAVDGDDVEAVTNTLALAMQGLMTLARAGVAADELRERASAAVATAFASA